MKPWSAILKWSSSIVLCLAAHLLLFVASAKKRSSEKIPEEQVLEVDLDILADTSKEDPNPSKKELERKRLEEERRKREEEKRLEEERLRKEAEEERKRQEEAEAERVRQEKLEAERIEAQRLLAIANKKKQERLARERKEAAARKARQKRREEARQKERAEARAKKKAQEKAAANRRAKQRAKEKAAAKRRADAQAKKRVEARKKAKAKKKVSRAYATSRRKPSYPNSLRRKGIEGTVKVKVYVSPNGRVDRATLYKSSGHSAMDRSALNAAKRWKYKPAYNGLNQKVSDTKIETIVFKIR